MYKVSILVLVSSWNSNLELLDHSCYRFHFELGISRIDGFTGHGSLHLRIRLNFRRVEFPMTAYLWISRLLFPKSTLSTRKRSSRHFLSVLWISYPLRLFLSAHVPVWSSLAYNSLDCSRSCSRSIVSFSCMQNLSGANYQRPRMTRLVLNWSQWANVQYILLFSRHFKVVFFW